MSYLSPIFKAGDTEDPNNYRGVAVADCLSKLFCKLLDKRIYAYLVETGFWSHLQNGFKEGRRTDDNIFVLRTLFNKYVTARKSKIYLAFVDFTKFFDCINRDALYFKLIQCGITGNVYNLLKSAYTDCCMKIKTANGLTKSFLCTTGVKQGCCMSPTLSNIFQNDLHQSFGQSDNHPVSLSDLSFNSMSWADDLVLVSESAQ